MKAIYVIKNKENKKVYVGSSIDLNKRWATHRYKLDQKKHPNVYLQNSWDKNGESSFEFSIVEEVEKSEDLIFREQHFIDLHKAADRDFGYNIAPIAGSSLGVKPTKETKKKLSKAQIERYKEVLNG
jgi:group I intron endonuclease